jgi:hypothetical protein
LLWSYFDETAVEEEDESGKRVFKYMLVGGCISTKSRWDRFEVEWSKALADEGVAAFHGKDFYSFKGEFDWYRRGVKDRERHVAFRNSLANIILENVSAIVGFYAGEAKGLKPVVKAYTDCVDYLLKDLQRSTDQKNHIGIVFARRPDVSPWRLLRTFENHNWDGRLGGCGIFRPEDVIPLQASDFVMHAMNSRWRDVPNEAFEHLKAGAKQRGVLMSLNLRGAPSSPDMPEVSGRISFSSIREHS